MEKIKVAWICHFSNKIVRQNLPLSKLSFTNFVKNILRKKKVQYSDSAPWVNNLIVEFENFEDIELHIIAPHKGMIPFTYEFSLNGIHYHFFRYELPFFISKIDNRLFKNRKKKFLLNRFLVKRFIKKIKPDIVNLIGTENPYYSITALDIENIPVFVSAQTVYTNPLRKIHSDSCHQLNWDIELKLHSKFRYFGCSGRMHRDLIIKNNPEAIIFKMFFPLQKPPAVKELPKEYDFVFFAAGVAKKKGIEDALDALAIVRKQKPNVKLNVSGRCANSYKKYLLQKIDTLNLQDNVIFNDYFPVHADMHQNLKKSKFALLPVKLDVIPGTIIESIFLGLPVVTYKTTGTPYLNKDGEAVLISEINDIEGLAENMLKLMNSPELAEKLKINAKKIVENEFDNTKSAKRFEKIYKAVIDHYHHNKPIPGELLFSTEEFPIY